MSSYVARQDKIKDQALQYVYQIMEEDIEELVKCAAGGAPAARIWWGPIPGMYLLYCICLYK